jgi:hypothetical protein
LDLVNIVGKDNVSFFFANGHSLGSIRGQAGLSKAKYSRSEGKVTSTFISAMATEERIIAVRPNIARFTLLSF